MKSLAIILVLTGVFGNIQTSWSNVVPTELSASETASNAVDKINVRFQNPLRDIDTNLESYIELLKVFDEFSRFDEAYATELLNKIKYHDTLSGTELFALRKMITTYYKINMKMQDFAKIYDFGGFKMSRTFASGRKNLPLLKAHLIWLSGQLLVIDHLKTMHEILYESNITFRRIVKNALLDKKSAEGNTKTLDDILKTDKYTTEVAKSERFNQQITLVSQIAGDLNTILKDEPATLTLLNAIMVNKSTAVIVGGEFKLRLIDFNFIDTIFNSISTVTGWLSGGFGNLAGAIKIRHGYFFENDIAYEQASESLRPMDIIVEKSGFTLTDKFIPGHFGHVAIYLGTRKQLEEINMWNHPDLIQYHDQIEDGKVILESVRSGVRLSTLHDFMNIDELTIMRKRDVLSNETLLREQITRGIDQIGKQYDFNFDTATLDKIVCSELIYIFYGNVHWPTKYRLGRATITPDDIAEILFYKNTKFDLIKFMVSKQEHRVELVNLDYIMDDFNYELRAKDGGPLENTPVPADKSENSYWKKETKCYIVTDTERDTNEIRTSVDTYSAMNKKVCNTTYKEFEYAEKASIALDR